MKIIKNVKVIVAVFLLLKLIYCIKVKIQANHNDEDEDFHQGKIRNGTENLEENEKNNCGPYLSCYGIKSKCCYRIGGDSYICVVNQCPLGLIRK
jgi:hypothetical protein